MYNGPLEPVSVMSFLRKPPCQLEETGRAIVVSRGNGESPWPEVESPARVAVVRSPHQLEGAWIPGARGSGFGARRRALSRHPLRPRRRSPNVPTASSSIRPSRLRRRHHLCRAAQMGCRRRRRNRPGPAALCCLRASSPP